MATPAEIAHLQTNGLYAQANEHDACGVGFVANIKGLKSHDIVKNALKILENLDHRGAVGADKLMGDGAGILIQLPDALYREEMAVQGVGLPAPGEYGVGMIFLPKEHASRLACEQEMERAIKAEGQVLLGWRDVPVNRDMPMSPAVRTREPVIRQVFIGRGHDVIVFHILDEAEVKFPFDGMVDFTDPETQDRLVIDADAARRQYVASVQAFREDYRTFCFHGGIDYVPLDTSMQFDRALMEYLLSRRNRF